MSEVVSNETEFTKAKEAFGSKEMANGDVWYVVSARWFALWRSYTSFDSDGSLGTGAPLSTKKKQATTKERPGQLDNSDIAISPHTTRAPICILPSEKDEKEESFVQSFATTLKEKLQCGHDYSLVPEALWKLLVSWYGPIVGPSFRRYVIKEGTGGHSQTFRVEVYLLKLKVQVTDQKGLINPTSEEEVVSSKLTIVGALKKKLCKNWSVTDEKRARIWDVSNSKNHKLVKDEATTLENIGISEGSRLLLEVQLETGQWPKEITASTSNVVVKKRKKGFWKSFVDFVLGPPWDDDGGDDPADEDDPPSPPGTHPRGICGLNNLGNTFVLNFLTFFSIFTLIFESFV